MANITVELTADQIVAAKDHFSTDDNLVALEAFRQWVSNEADGWYLAYIKKDIDKIVAALFADPEQIAAIMAALAI